MSKGLGKAPAGLCSKEQAGLLLLHLMQGKELILPFLFIPHLLNRFPERPSGYVSHPLGKATCMLSQSAVSLRFTARWTALMARRWRSAQLSSFQASSHKDELLALLPPGGCCRHIACPWKYGFPVVQIIELCRTPYLVLSPRSTGDTDLVQFPVSAFLCKCCARDSLESEARSKLEE